jgi:REP element-mobilizing transposase RayT
MSVRQQVHQRDGILFITFTCQGWLHLFELTNGYDLVYKWFDYLKSKGHFVCGYVIMPNHIHVLLGIRVSEQPINTIVSNGKRFMAYELKEAAAPESL